MSRLLLSAVLCFTAVLSADSFARPGTTPDAPVAERPQVGLPGSVLHSSGTAHGLAARETAGPDTFVLYGGPDHPTEGKFQQVDGVTPDWGGGNGLPGGYGGGPDAWTPADLTHQRVYWHADTHNAGNLNNNGPGNHAMWCGLPAGDPDTAGWANPQGYGNDWSDGLIYVSDPVADEIVGQTVSLEFFLNYDTEVDWDFVYVEYVRDGVWVEVASATGTNADGGGTFAAPGVRFSEIQTAPIEYLGNDYAYHGLVSGGIIIRIRFESDAAYADEDGLFVSSGGAAQIDDITVSHSEGAFLEDFEGVGPYLFYPEQLPFAGDFADVYPRLTDIDPCRENTTPVVGFIDYGQTVRNGPGHTGATSTGGSTAPGVEYGIPGNYVLNYHGGLAFGQAYVENEVWSPDIYLDKPGPEDDGVDMAGVFMRFTVWADLPFYPNLFFYVWHVRSALPGEGYGGWSDRNFIYNDGRTPRWNNNRQDLSDLIQPGAERIQVALGAVDASQWSQDFGKATPSPVFDNGDQDDQHGTGRIPEDSID